MRVRLAERAKHGASDDIESLDTMAMELTDFDVENPIIDEETLPR
jgi:hypothetical protein